MVEVVKSVAQLLAVDCQTFLLSFEASDAGLLGKADLGVRFL